MNGEVFEELGLLVRDIGDAGVERMTETPGLAAAVDQHVAEVRGLVPDPSQPALMDYLSGFAEDAFRRGWWPGDTHDWEFVRIVAVCWMMRNAPVH
ncbi:DUF6401 family natural product biosynthesis protein [Actinomadura harenae]|uniref:Uncharacterized protein n=1 Tax=Actinomadura harenae TaxID=2483351 RepID=A0A3M2M4E8_9ACTN|nr:DUF6401 family natural product biosynthesis protein [Actinomadura harenae]RMI41988.1 hypothetical protein EBO15_21165 [Actinomadura harenae]